LQELLKIIQQQIKGLFNVLGNGADFGANGDEIVVILPSRHKMKMEMISDACAGDLSEVQTDVDAVGVKMTPDYGATAGKELHQPEMFGCGEFCEISNMTSWRQQKMAIGIGKAIEQGNRELVAEQQEMRFVK
jgi:hypothetical protein